jgi:hypothetical protein
LSHPDLFFPIGDGPHAAAPAVCRRCPVVALTAIMTLATAWSAGNPFGPSLDPDAAKDPAALRQRIADAVGLIANPTSPREPKKEGRRRGSHR